MTQRLLIDGAHGEGGGQILRTGLSLAAITRRPIAIENIRAGRPNPGLAAQHVTAARAVARLCDGQLSGDALRSKSLEFTPRAPLRAGDYCFDVGAVGAGGSAGATTLVLHAVLLPLALAVGDSTATIRGGTHMAWSPPFDYIRDIWLPCLARSGLSATARLTTWGWYPVGRGEIQAAVSGLGGARAGSGARALEPLTLRERGALKELRGRAVAANLPAQIAQRMADRVRGLLESTGVPVRVTAERVRAACPGAGIFLAAEYAHIRCGFSALGRVGKPAEAVAEEAVAAFAAHHESGAAFDRHLSDQMIAPLALASGPSVFTTACATPHLATNAWVVEQFGLARVIIDADDAGRCRVSVEPRVSS